MIRNLTPHAVTILVDGRDPLVILPDPAGPARCRATGTNAGLVDGIPAVATTFGAVEGLPDPVPGVFLLVSGLVLDRVADLRAPSSTGAILTSRTAEDLCAPGELVRGPDGQPTGCRGVRVRR